MIGIDMEMPATCGKCRFATAFECSINRKFIPNHDKKSAHCPLVVLGRPKGEWKPIKQEDNTHIWVCSECGKQNKHGITIEKFCWNCGADMRGGAK